jgi:hypothetical protein
LILNFLHAYYGSLQIIMTLSLISTLLE